MTSLPASGRWATIPGQIICRRSPVGFAHTSTLSGTQAMAAVGRLAAPHDEGALAAVDAVLQDVAMTEGYDAESVFALANAALAIEELGSLDGVAMFARSLSGDDGAYVTAVGMPPPVVIAPDGLAVSAERGASLSHGWTVILAEAGPLLRPAEVRQVLRTAPGTTGSATRTILAVRVN
jgi:hypothetical protein